MLKGTKAETLELLLKDGFPVPPTYFFTVQQWIASNEKILHDIEQKFSSETHLAVRSSAIAEDTSENSMAGAFESVLKVDAKSRQSVTEAIEKVISSFDGAITNQVLIQPMVQNVTMSGVLMTKSLDDGSPYYVVNYDDSTGETDTVTNGSSINKTVYIYNGVTGDDFDSAHLRAVIQLVVQLEEYYKGIPLDIEFAVDKSGRVHLLQVRRITTSNTWKHEVNALVSERIKYLESYLEKLMKPRPDLLGRKTLLGLMPDWNPAEMIGVVPHPLAMSLYRELITKSTWRIAREKMGYRKLPNVELMVSLFGRTYIDVRNSMNSFLPEGLPDSIWRKLVDAYINRLEANPHLADKIEFEIVPTTFDFQFDEKFNERYEGTLNKEEFIQFKVAFQKLTTKALLNSENSSLNIALADIEHLKRLQAKEYEQSLDNPFSVADRINTLVEECIQFGTLPFAIVARHGFIAESWLRSVVNRKLLTGERVAEYKRSFRTIAGDLSNDFYKVCKRELSKSAFLTNYGHLRPSSYDILSPRYCDRADLFDGVPQKPETLPEFCLTKDEEKNLNTALADCSINVSANDLLIHAKKAIIGREYAKFIFTKHLSNILEHVASWGQMQGLNRAQMAMLTLQDIQAILFAPFTNTDTNFMLQRIAKAKTSYDVASSFKLSYLIRSTRDIYVVPQQRSSPNFIGNKRIEAATFLLTPYSNNIPDLQGKIVCIEGADPGYDWIFSRNIAGLVTKYGGANSHMAIRCAEYNLPAAIGCGEQPFERVVNAGKCLLDCLGKRLEPIKLGAH